MTLEDWDRIGRNTPTLVKIMPSGRFFMEDFSYAAGLAATIKALAENKLLHSDALTVTRKAIGENCEDASNWNE